ncbi:topoisomerase II [Rubinisphaera margarita]|uniref:topoisomerase II n=1 Tax=Rubinisphaera margarita TaxID=2909586 RepID=UPI001EE7B288|nr:topoisomerase II [Rubinisphaera margarita]MCG6154664.1 topoisomerase II [Rubinisphaera margarita]
MSVVVGRIHAEEAYSKELLLKLLGISQKFWDKMLDEGLPFTRIGHTRWVTGEAVLNYLHRNAERKPE